MVRYEPSPQIIEASLNELQFIASWLTTYGTGSPHKLSILIGGWAVDSYNPWSGSVDIDLVTLSDVRTDLIYYLRTERDFIANRLPGEKTQVSKTTPYGEIRIDFIPKGEPMQFEGQPENGLDLVILNDNCGRRSIRRGISLTVPNRSLLTILKLKAAWDRQYRLEHRDYSFGKDPLWDPEWETGKLLKDRSDIISLLDPSYGGREIELQFVGDQFKRYPFLCSSFELIGKSRDSIDFYGRMEPREVVLLVDQVLELSAPSFVKSPSSE